MAMIDTDHFDAIAKELGLPDDWRAIGYDEPEYMVREDSIYRSGKSNSLVCVWPDCIFTRKLLPGGLEGMFRHVHGPHHKKAV